MAHPRQSEEPAFQATWALLHLAAVVMHAGSFLYHVRRLTSSQLPPTCESHPSE